MILPFTYYLDNKMARKGSPNPSMAASLLAKATVRLKRIEEEKFTAEKASLIFEDSYEAVREACQSLMELYAFKPYSHEALVSFLKEYYLLPEPDVNALDGYGILRNNSVYRAQNVSLETCKEAMGFAKRTIPQVKEKFEVIRKKHLKGDIQLPEFTKDGK